MILLLMSFQKIFWTLSLSCRKNYCAQKYFLQSLNITSGLKG